MALYKYMDIGTAKPSAEEQSGTKFHLIDVADPAESFNVGEFQKLAHGVIDDIIRRKMHAIVVGGSGLYVRAAVDGLDTTMPAENAELRAKLEQEVQTYGNLSLHRKLAKIDPKSGERIHPNNVKRVIRALEIYGATGIAPSVMFEIDAERQPVYPNAIFFGLNMSRDQLYARIEKRVDAMIGEGLVEEVSRLLHRGIDPSATSMQGLGYKEIVGYLRGDCALDDAIALLKKNTRRFAKRQLTWFRADSRIKWINIDNRTASEVSKQIKEILFNE